MRPSSMTPAHCHHRLLPAEILMHHERHAGLCGRPHHAPSASSRLAAKGFWTNRRNAVPRGELHQWTVRGQRRDDVDEVRLLAAEHFLRIGIVARNPEVPRRLRPPSPRRGRRPRRARRPQARATHSGDSRRRSRSRSACRAASSRHPFDGGASAPRHVGSRLHGPSAACAHDPFPPAFGFGALPCPRRSCSRRRDRGR